MNRIEEDMYKEGRINNNNRQKKEEEGCAPKVL
jgi:hypothetical protein